MRDDTVVGVATMMSALVHADVIAQAWVVTHRSAPLDPIMVALGTAGRAGAIWIILASFYVLVRRMSLRGWIQVTLAVILAGVVTIDILKPIVSRPRPFTRPGSATVLGQRPMDTSMPSGHGATAFAGALALGLLLPRSRVVFAALAVAIAYSRVYVGVHYPLDVIAGAAVGCSATLTVWRIGQRLGARSDGATSAAGPRDRISGE